MATNKRKDIHFLALFLPFLEFVIIVVLVTPQGGCVRPHVNSFHFVRSFATCSICVHEVKPSLRCSLSTVRRQVVLGLPLLLLPSLAFLLSSLALLIFSSLRTWPNHLQRLSAIMSETGIIPAFLYSSLFVIFSGQKIRKIFLKHPLWNLSNRQASRSVIFHVSAP